MEFKAAESLPAQIADYIRNQIIRAELKPGENIRESRLAEELSVSRSPVREALRILERQRLVEQTPRKGTKVTQISREQTESLYDVAGALIVLSARKCLEKCTPEDLKIINQAVEKASQAVARSDIHGYYQHFFEFTLACLSATRDSLLEQMIFDLLPGIRRMQFLTFFLRSDTLERNLSIVQKGNAYLQADNSEMAVKTVIEYIEAEKKFALKALREGLVSLAIEKKGQNQVSA